MSNPRQSAANQKSTIRKSAGEKKAEPRPLVVTADERLRDEVARIAADAGVDLDHARSVGEAGRSWATAPVVLIGDDLADGLARAALPRRDGLVLLGTDLDDASVWQRGKALGAHQILFLPDAGRWLEGLLAETKDDAKPRGPVVAVLAGRGGAGASTLAAALALTATRAGRRTTLVDLDPIGGGIDLLFGLECAAGPRWSELAQWRDHRLSGRSLRDALPAYGVRGIPGDVRLDEDARGLPILTWPRPRGTERIGPIDAEAARAVLDVLAQAGDLVVADLPRSLDEAAVEALSIAAVTLVIVPAEVRAAAAAAQLASVARLVAGDVRAVVRMPSPGGLAPADVAEVVGLPLAGVIGPDRRMSLAAEHGEPPGLVGRGSVSGFCRPFLAELFSSFGGGRGGGLGGGLGGGFGLQAGRGGTAGRIPTQSRGRRDSQATA